MGAINTLVATVWARASPRMRYDMAAACACTILLSAFLRRSMTFAGVRDVPLFPVEKGEAGPREVERGHRPVTRERSAAAAGCALPSPGLERAVLNGCECARGRQPARAHAGDQMYER